MRVPRVKPQSLSAKAEVVPQLRGLVLFIHGIMGAGDASTWAQFPTLLREDTKVSQHYDVDVFEYPTHAIRPLPSTRVPEAAKMLRAKLDTNWKKYIEIAVIAHSQGGLVTRRYIADELMASRQHRVGRVLYFATPHLGALGGKIADLGPGGLQQTRRRISLTTPR
jgi:triacylglycerol esterase/lipase EstA (alpha/beta hydrolase family)